MTDLPSSAKFARLILSFLVAWIMVRGYQLRHDLLLPPPAEVLTTMTSGSTASSNSNNSRNLRGQSTSFKSQSFTDYLPNMLTNQMLTDKYSQYANWLSSD